jgi:hypothetical protein
MSIPTNIMGSKRKPPSLRVDPTLKLSAQDTGAKLKDQNTGDWLTRNEASDLLKCSPQTLKNYEDRGFLHPLRAERSDGGGGSRIMIVYSPKELAALPRRNAGGQPRILMREPGELAARAFELFRDGRCLDEIVVELRETPERIRQLHEEWLDFTQARYVISSEAKSAFEKLVGPFADVADLLEAVKRLKDRN